MKMKKQTGKKRGYRLIGTLTVLLTLATVLLGALVSEDAGVVCLFVGTTVISLGAILFSAVESAAEYEREAAEADEVAPLPRKMAKRS